MSRTKTLPCCPSTFLGLLYLALNIPAKLNGQSVIGIVNTGSSSIIVLQSCDDQLNLKEDGWIAYTLTNPNDTSSKERETFKDIRIDVEKKIGFTASTCIVQVTLQCFA